MGATESSETHIAPWLPVDDAQRAVDFYITAFGAVDVYRLDSEGGLEVAQLSVRGVTFWIQDDIDAGTGTPGAPSIRMILSVQDPDAVFDQAVAAGAAVVSPVSDAYGWRTGRITDPFGHDWEISRQLV